MTFIRAAATALILLVSSCAARNEIVVRSSNGQGRSFEYDAKKGELVAWNTRGKLLQMWTRPVELMVIGQATRRTVKEGCRGGFLSSPTDSQSSVLIEIHLCPAPDAPPGWQGWHADFDLHAPAGGVTGTLPPVLDFAIAWDGELKTLQVTSRTGRGAIAVPAGAAVVRSHPELFGLAVAMGVVPRANDGIYLVE